MSDITVELLTSPQQVSKYEQRWNELAGSRTQLRWEWLGSWADHYCREKRLMVFVVRDGEQIIGFTPWYSEVPRFAGRTIRFLGDGKVCTDHMTLLVQPRREDDVVSAVANWLIDYRIELTERHARWSHLVFIGCDRDDSVMRLFNQKMLELGCTLDQREGVPCYGIELPATMDEYVKRRSKSGKRECRKIRDWLSDERFEVFVPQTINELQEHWYEFIDLHTMRRSESDERGCFDHVPFGEFLWDASTKLFDSGLLRLTFVLFEGQPISVQHALVSEDRWLFYQSGMDGTHSEFKPGQLALYQTIQEAIDEGKTYYDMMRGDESYKARWRAEAVATTEIRIAAPQRTAMMQQRAWQWRTAVTEWAHDKLRQNN